MMQAAYQQNQMMMMKMMTMIHTELQKEPQNNKSKLQEKILMMKQIQ
jgi:hypothetical protein